jgi:hypothetical protein
MNLAKFQLMDKLPNAEMLLADISYELIQVAYYTEKLIRDVKGSANIKFGCIHLHTIIT